MIPLVGLLENHKGLCIREISESLGIKLGTVKSRLNRALEFLRYYIQSNGSQKTPDLKELATPDPISHAVKVWRDNFNSNGEFTRELSQITNQYGILGKAAGYLMKEAIYYLLENRDVLGVNEIEDAEKLIRDCFIKFCMLYGDPTKSADAIANSFVSNLKPRAQQIVRLRYQSGLDQKEISAIIGIKSSTVYWYLSNVRKKLRTRLINLEDTYRQKRA